MRFKFLKLPLILLFSVSIAGVISAFALSNNQKKQPAIYINPVRFAQGANAPWNNITADSKNSRALAENLKDERGAATTVDVYMETPTTFPFYRSDFDGKTVKAVYEDKVLWRGWGSKEAWAFRLAGLQPNYLYTFTFLSTQRSYEGNKIALEINGIAVVYEGVKGNLERTLKVSVKSDSKGDVIIKVDKVDGSVSSLAALIVEDAADNYHEPEAYRGDAIQLTESTPTPNNGRVKKPENAKPKKLYSDGLVNREARISKSRLVRPDHNPRNHAIEMYGGYEVEWEDPDNKTLATANVHDPESAWRVDDVSWKDGKLEGLNSTKPQYYFKQFFHHVKQPWKDLSVYYYMNRETRLDTIVFYQLDNRPINPGATCNFWYALYGSSDNFTWTKILDSLSFSRANRWKGYVTNDPNYYCYLRLKIESNDPNLYNECKTNSSLLKIVASGKYRGGYITSFMDPDDLPTAVDTKNTFNDFFGTNGFNSDPDTLRAKFNYFRSYMSYGDFSNELGGKFFINQNTNGQYNTHFKTIKHKGEDGHAVRWLKNDIIYRNKRLKALNPDIKILYCIQQGANWYVNQKATQEGGWYYYKDVNGNGKADYPQEYFPYSTTSYLLTGPGGLGAQTQKPTDIKSKVTEYRVNPDGYEKAAEVLAYWTKDGKVSPWISSYFDVSNPETPNTQIYNRGMRVPWYKHKQLANPAKRDSVLSDPRTYAYDAAFFYNLTAVHGPNEVDLNTLWVQPGQVKKTGHGTMDMLEWENETDQLWHGPFAHMWPQWAAAYMSAIMDGNMGQIAGPLNNNITGYMCAAPLLDFLYQGTTKDGCYDIKLALDALVAIRTKRKKQLNEQGITTHPGNGMPLYILPPNFWANWHHYSGTSGGQRSAQYLRFPNEKDEKGLTATDDGIYETIREQTAWLKSFYPQVKTTITEWGYGTHTGGKFSPLKQDFGVESSEASDTKNRMVNELTRKKEKLKATAVPDKKAIAKLDKEINKLEKAEALTMPEEAGLFYQQANWLVRGSLEIWFSGLDKIAQYWMADKGGYYDIFTLDEKTGKLMPDHDKKWMVESKNDYTTFTGMGLYGNPRFGHGGYPAKTSAYAFHNMKKILGNNVAVKREYLSDAEKIKSYLTYNEGEKYYALVVFKATAQNLKTKDFNIKLPVGATNVEVVDFVLDSYSPKVTPVEGSSLTRTITEKPIIIKFKIKG